MNSGKVKEMLAALRTKLEGALRTADTSGLQSAPAEIDSIVAEIDGKTPPTHQDGSPWPKDPDGNPATDTAPATTTPEPTTTPAPIPSTSPTTTPEHAAPIEKSAKVDGKKHKS